MKFAHMSDVHLGSWGNNPVMREFSIKAFEKAVDKCYEEGVEFILIAGDLFDTSLPPIDILRKAVAKFRECSEKGVRVYAVPGSHDYSPTGKTFLNVLEDADLLKIVEKYDETDGKINLKFTVDSTGAKITGMAGKMGALETKNFERINKKTLENEDGFKIFLFHSGIEEYKSEVLKDMLAVPIKLLPKNFHYYATGHVHETLHKEEDFGTVVFPGPLFPTDMKELENYNSGFFINELGRNLKVNFVPIKLFDVEVVRINADNKTITQIENELIDSIERLDLKGKALILKVKGILKSGKTSDIDINIIAGKAEEKGAIIVKKNFNKFFSREFEEINIRSDFSVENIEKELITKHSENMKLASFAGIERSITSLMKAFEEEKQEGETKDSFESRLSENVKKILKI